jgi:hypothetical protein
MSVQYINTLFPGEIGVHPRLVRLACNDTYAAVTAAGYLGSTVLSAFPIYPDDYIFTVYGTGQFAIFNPSITNSIVTLVPYVPPGIPVFSGSSTVGDIPEFNNTTGGVTDSGIPANTLATYYGATIVNDVPLFNTTTGRIADSGTQFSALQLSANIKALQYPYAGGSTTATFNLTGVTTNSVISAVIITASNPAYVVSIKVLSAGVITVQFSADPGANTTVGIIAFLSPQ